MNNSLDLDKLRLLLHKYYEAETTPEEEILLESFFRETPAWEIPEEMTHDFRLFSAMAELHPSAANMEIPDGLFEKIYDISGTSGAKRIIKTQRNHTRHIGYALAAACACILLAIGMNWMTAPREIKTKPIEYSVESPKEQPVQPSILSDEMETQTDSPEPRHISKAPRPRQSKAMVENEDISNEMEDGFIEITDPEEAEKIVIEIGKLLAANSQKTNEAIVHLEKTVNEYKEITKSILR